VGRNPGDNGVEGLGPWLDQRQMEKTTEDNRRKQLVAIWEQVQPIVIEAVERVNAKLAAHSEFKLYLYGSDFFGRDYSGYGTLCKLAGGKLVGYDTIPFVVTEQVFYVAGLHNWGEGLELSFESVTVQVVADAVADAVKGMIEG
jgi:hypothetical protein